MRLSWAATVHCDGPLFREGFHFDFFHPFFKGALVNGSGSDGHLWTETISQLLSLHDSDIDSCVSDGSVSANNGDSALIDSRWDELTALADRHVEKLQRNESVNKSALEIEIDTYFQLPRSADVEGSDVLSWWKDKVISRGVASHASGEVLPRDTVDIHTE